MAELLNVCFQIQHTRISGPKWSKDRSSALSENEETSVGTNIQRRMFYVAWLNKAKMLAFKLTHHLH